MSYANRKQMSTNRTAAIIIMALIHIALGYALVTGLAYNVIKKAAEDLKTFDVEESRRPRRKSRRLARHGDPAAAADRGAAADRSDQSPGAGNFNHAGDPAAGYYADGQAGADDRARAGIAAVRAPRVVSKAARAKANLNSLFSTDDYPQSAIRNEEQGTTASAPGRGHRRPGDRLRITSSSGSSALDTATCNILRRRGALRRRRTRPAIPSRQRHCGSAGNFRKNNSQSESTKSTQES